MLKYVNVYNTKQLFPFISHHSDTTIIKKPNIMIIKKLISNRFSLEYSKSEIALILISGIMLLMLNFIMITGIKHQHNTQSVEQVHARR